MPPKLLHSHNSPLLPTSGILLCDVDKTLVKPPRYAYTADKDELCEAIATTIEPGGLQFGLSSDTPATVLARRGEDIGANDLIVAEKGAVVRVNGVLDYDEEVAGLFADSYARTKDALLNSGFEVWDEDDPVEVLAGDRQIGQPGQSLVLMNPHRICSLGLFVRKVTEAGALVIDPGLTTRAIRLARLPAQHQLEGGVDIDDSPEHGLLIAKAGNVSKRGGTLKLLGLLGLSGTVGMLGDSMGDFLGLDLGLHYAVANADPAYKAKAAYRAGRPFTGGVIETLRHLQSGRR